MQATARNGLLRALDRYIGNIAFGLDGTAIATTSPRGTTVEVAKAADMALTAQTSINAGCGIAPDRHGFTLTAGTGSSEFLTGTRHSLQARMRLKWDNYLVVV